MTGNALEKMVIFDYSGTLSLEAPRFARPENLVRTLAETGLAALGVSTGEIFWEEIVGPTWTLGSTTAIGYGRVIAERIAAIGLAPGAKGTDIATATARFVDRYLAHSRIDPRWRPILTELAADPAAAVVIATDHYAEATEAIARHLASLDIRKKRGTAPDYLQNNRELSPFFIANSADIGFWKADRRFWEHLRLNPRLDKVRSLLIIDDFGFNEEQGDIYAKRTKVEARREKTREALWETFQKPPEVIPFFLTGAERNPDGDAGRRIDEAIQAIHAFL